MVDRHQIKAGHRYDNNNKSEIRGWVVTFGLGSTGTFEWQDFQPRKIHKDDINISKIFTNDEDAFSLNLTDFNNNLAVFIGSWEYDWYASNKLVLNNCSTNLDHSVAVKMKFSDEWYFGPCGIAKDWWPNLGSPEVFSNQKCMFDLKRTQ